MRKPGFAAALLLVLAGCAANPVPAGYDGPLAVIANSARPLGRDGADYFLLTRVNGQFVDDAVARVARPEPQNGDGMTPVMLERDVPARAATFTIRGRTKYRTPILDMQHDVYDVSGDVAFTPEPQHRYVVRGDLSDDSSEIWIEDAATGTVMGEKVVIKGKATIGFLEK
jgi:hypothetical protein